MTAFEDSAMRDLAPFRRERLDVLAQLHRDAPNDLALPFADPRPAGLVCGAHAGAERRVGLRSCWSEIDAEGAPIVRVAGAGDQAGLFEAIEMPGHGGALDPDALRELPLAAALRLGDGVEHEERRERLSVRGQDLLEVGAETLGRVDQLSGDGALERIRCRNRSSPNG